MRGGQATSTTDVLQALQSGGTPPPRTHPPLALRSSASPPPDAPYVLRQTIGDAFIAAAGIPTAQPDHTLRVALFATEAMHAANATLVDVDDPDKGFVNIRAGFHTGAVVASVIGNLKPKYTLFGATMNVASRMESTSEKNRVTMSPQAHAALMQQAPEARTEARGLVEVKSKGELELWFLDTSPGALEALLAAKRMLRNTAAGSGTSSYRAADSRSSPHDVSGAAPAGAVDGGAAASVAVL